MMGIRRRARGSRSHRPIRPCRPAAEIGPTPLHFNSAAAGMVDPDAQNIRASLARTRAIEVAIKQAIARRLFLMACSASRHCSTVL